MREIKSMHEVSGRKGNVIALTSYPPEKIDPILDCLREDARNFGVSDYEFFAIPSEKLIGWVERGQT